jgi:hypothetical protein
MGNYIEGNVALLAATFTDNDPTSENYGQLEDPTALVLAWSNNGVPEEQVWPGGNITHVSTGSFQYAFDTTGYGVFGGAIVLFTWRATGNAQSTQTQSIGVELDPNVAND